MRGRALYLQEPRLRPREFGITYAMQSPDPKKTLEGTGNFHRHVKLKSKSGLETAGLSALLKAALARREKMGLTLEK